MYFCSMEKVIVTFALPDERVDISMPGVEVIPVVTHVGKACSALATMRAVLQHRPRLVLNVGTAGTLRHNIGDIIVSRHTFDRDLVKTQLPGICYDYRQDDELPWRLPSVLNGKETWAGDFVVNTGDEFVTDVADTAGDVYDMEAFAQMLVCQEEQVSFMAVKYVTDIIGQNSVKQWADKLADARAALTDYFGKYLK